MDIQDLLQGPLRDIIVGQISNQFQTDDSNKTNVAVDGILSTLLGGLTQNASTEQGASSLLSALDRDHDGSILDDLTGFLTGASTPQNPRAANGDGILGHILGSQKEEAVDQISKASGMDKGQIFSMMIKLAPIVLGLLGKMKAQQPAVQQTQEQSGGGIFDMLQKATQSINNPVQQRQAEPDSGGIMDNLIKAGMNAVMDKFLKK